MKTFKTIHLLFILCCGIILICKILNLLFHFSDRTNNILNTMMFCLIGIAYLFAGYIWTNKMAKGILFLCGAFLIIMNLLPETVWITWTGVVCILIPLFIFRFSKEAKEEKETMD